MAEDRKRVFVRPPDNRETMTDEEQDAWAEALLDHIVAQSTTPPSPSRP